VVGLASAADGQLAAGPGIDRSALIAQQPCQPITLGGLGLDPAAGSGIHEIAVLGWWWPGLGAHTSTRLGASHKAGRARADAGSTTARAASPEPAAAGC
jgi:hypothetical protein